MSAAPARLGRVAQGGERVSPVRSARDRRYIPPGPLPRAWGRVVGAAYCPGLPNRAPCAGFVTGSRRWPENPTRGFPTDEAAWAAYKEAVRALAEAWRDWRTFNAPLPEGGGS